MLKIFLMIFSFALAAQASSDELRTVEVLNAGYYSKYGTVELLVSCDGDVDIKINNCTELIPHAKCVATVVGSACQDQSQHWKVKSRDELNYKSSFGIENLGSEKFENTILLIRGKNFEKEIQFSRI